MTIGLIRQLRGHVKFRAKGSCLEKFLNLAAAEEIPIWEVAGRTGVLYACTFAGCYKKLAVPARKTGTRLRVQERHGIAFPLRKIKKRPGLMLGAVVFFGLVHFLSLFVWNIQIQGNTQLSSDKIIQAVDELGLGVGSYQNNLNLELLQQETMLKFPEISWMTMYTKGSTLVIDLREGQEKPEIIPNNIPCNIKAKTGGQILSVEAKSGQSVVEPGDVVVPGDLLISGITEGVNGETLLYHSIGTVTASTTHTLTEVVPLKQTVLVPAGKEIIRHRLRMFGMEIPLSFSSAPQGDTYTREIDKKELSVFGISLPIQYLTEYWQENQWQEITYTAQEAQAVAEENLEKRREEELAGITVVSSQKRISVENGSLVYELVFQCEEEIGYEDEVLIN